MKNNLKKGVLSRISLRFYFRQYSQIPSSPRYFHMLLLLPALIKNAPTSFSSFLRFVKVNKIPSSIISYKGELPSISILLVVAQKDFDKLIVCINQIVKHSLNPISKIEIVVPYSQVLSCVKILEHINLEIPLKVLNEDEIIPADLREIMKQGLKHKYGWAIQQLLTLYMVVRSDSDGVLTVDADTLILRDQIWLNEKLVQVLFRSSEYHTPYYQLINKIFPDLELVPYSHVTHHMLFQPQLLRNFLEKSGYLNLEELMIRVLEFMDSTQESPFCIEFEPYAQALHNFYPNTFEIRRFSNSPFSKIEDNLEITTLVAELDNQNVYNSISFHSWNN
jgi:hypothetical protein